VQINIFSYKIEFLLKNIYIFDFLVLQKTEKMEAIISQIDNMQLFIKIVEQKNQIWERLEQCSPQGPENFTWTALRTEYDILSLQLLETLDKITDGFSKGSG